MLTQVLFDPEADPGERFPSSVVRDELGEVVPTEIPAGTITELMLADGAVTEDKIDALAVTTPKIADGAVTTPKIADVAVTTAKIGAAAVTKAKVGAGVMTCTDDGGTPISLSGVPLTAAEYAALAVKDPNTLYFVT